MNTLLPGKDCSEGACGVDNSPPQELRSNDEINISEEIEKYLDNLTNKDVEFIDPKLKREREKLQDLLTSYKKLSEQLDRKCAEASKEGIHVPKKEILARRAEIYALLHPELYKNRREEEKKRFIEKFSSRRHFSEVDKVCPLDITPIHTVLDKRQQEKDRFCKLVASAPSRFHNVLSEPTQRFKRVTRPPATPPCLVDVRETEKDRLARIFATSAAFIRDPNLKRKLLEKYKETTRRSQLNTPDTSNRQITQGVARGMCQSLQEQRSKQENTVSQLTSDLNEMVRIGEYSPLNKYSSPRQGRTVLGIGEHDETEKHLAEERQFECLNYYREKENQAKLDKAVMVSPPNGRRSVSSASTQTDDLQPQIESPVQAISPSQIPVPRDFVDFSPREKLLSDLYGYRPHNDFAQEEKIKRIAYAQALQEQIKEKKRLEEERKRREREEEEHEERRYKEQTERIQKEYTHERNLDFVIKRQSQEEMLQRRLAKMDMEAKDLKRQERLSRLSNERDQSPEGSVHNLPSLASAYSGLQTHKNGARLLDRDLSGAATAALLPEQLPDPDVEEDWSKMTGLEGIDLLREHRSQKERLQLPPVIDPTVKIERRKARPAEKPQANGYIPSTVNDTARRVQSYRQQAEAILRAPLDDDIHTNEATNQRSAASLPPPQRPRSPVLPAVRTETMLKRNSRILDDKWKVPQEGTHDLGRTLVDKENVLTQLGAFRRQLAQEHHKLEERIRGQSSS